MYYIFILLFLLLFCKEHPKNPYFYFPKDDIQSIQLSYGKKISNDISKANEVLTWGPTFKIQKHRICIQSHNDHYQNKEWGPTLKICIKNTSNAQELIESSLIHLNSQHHSRNRPEGNLNFENELIHLNFNTLSELTNLVEDNSVQKAFVGNKILLKELSKNIDTTSFYSTSLNGKNIIETSFSAPYFSVFQLEDIVLIVFPTSNITLTPRANHYLTLELNSSDKMQGEIDNFFSSVTKVNNKLKRECQKEKLKIKELFFGSSFQSKKFLELYNPNNEKAICIEKYFLSKDDEIFTIENPSGFIFPNSTKLFTEEKSPLEGIEVDSDFWKYIYRTKSITIYTKEDLVEKIQLDNKHEYKWGQDGFSYHVPMGLNCSVHSLIYLGLDSLCGSPGIYFLIDKNGNGCKPKDILLTEINPTGFLQGDRVEDNYKFLELQYVGNDSCDPSDLVVEIDSINVPLFSVKKAFKPKEVIVVGNAESFFNISGLIDRKLDFLKPQSKIILRNKEKSQILFNGLEENQYIITQDSEGVIHSLVLKDNFYIHHPTYKSKKIYVEYSNSHDMSPGELVKIQSTNEPKALVNEVSWAGSYLGTKSVAYDRFIELYTQNLNSIKIEIITEDEQNSFSFPVSNNSPLTVLAKNDLQCFPNINLVRHSKFRLYSEKTKLNIYNNYDNRLLSTFEYFPKLENGFHSSSLKLRKSYVYTGFKNRYVNSTKSTQSTYIISECLEHTYATPEEENEFDSFLVFDKFQDKNYEYFLVKQNNLEISNIKLQHYNHDLSFNTNLIIPVRKLNEFYKLQIQLNDSMERELIYQSLENSNDLKLFNLDGLYIQEIHPHPNIYQNEWFLLCNHSDQTIDIRTYEIEDNSKTDRLTTYFDRKGIQLPSNLQASSFLGDSPIISPSQCAYVVDPDSNSMDLQPKGNLPTLVFTTVSTSTIGNGLSKSDTLDLFKWVGGKRIHVHSYGNKYSHSPFTITAESDEIIRLKEGKFGELATDYEVLK